MLGVKARGRVATFFKYFVLIAVGVIMVYPLLWMISATFKTNNDIFSGIGLIPQNPTLEGYRTAMNNYGGDIDIVRSMINTYSYVLPKVLFTVVSACITAYGFGRFQFKGRNFYFAIMMGTLFLPQVVLNVPQYLLFNQFGWIDSPWYLAIIVPTLFAVDTYFVFMLVQFMRNIPRELDEAAQIDGCNSFQTLVKVIAPMLKPALVSCALFQFMWSSNDFMGPLLYVKTPQRYPAALFVKLSMDADNGFAWNRVLAVSLISILPSLIVFFAAQRQFVDGISAGSVKG
ncbi:MAG: carbohydrate ABC transporter permease [Oscillospiraceae bacterium]